MTNAIIMASGLGTRMKPLTDVTPKPLIRVNNKPMIETVIDALCIANVSNIYVVVGYLANQFGYLKEKYRNVKLIKNTDYHSVNNISSIYYACDKLREGACFICEADLYIADSDIFNVKNLDSCYFGKMVEGYSSDWVFEVNDNGFITRVGKCGTDCFNMVGLSYFSKEDAVVLADSIKSEYGKPGYETLFWDDVVDRNLDKLKLKIHQVVSGQIFEIDTVEELEHIDNEVRNGSRKTS